MLKVFLSKQAKRFLEKIPAKHALQIVAKIDQLANDPNSLPSKQLEGYPMFRRVKSGEYRMIYRVIDGMLKLLVVRIGKRNDDEVYKNLDSLDTDPEN